ncbi:MAG: ATP-binding protein [Bacteroidia bacterium]|nr:MAG: ATP-binding protein [Bacteroidia bacterium]
MKTLKQLSAVEFSISKNRGKLLENLVFLEYLKAGKALFYFKGNHECDFIVKDGNTMSPFQVSWDILEGSTKERELRGLNEACDYLGTKTGTIICFDHEDTFTYPNNDLK